MTPEAQRIAIAEACGWTKVHWYEDNAGPPILSGVPFLTEEQTLKMEPRLLRELKEYGRQVPEYLNDLNAMHSAESVLTWEQSCEFENIIWGIITGSGFPKQLRDGVLFHLLYATAAQRAEAFLKTIGKWVNS